MRVWDLGYFLRVLWFTLQLVTSHLCVKGMHVTCALSTIHFQSAVSGHPITRLRPWSWIGWKIICWAHAALRGPASVVMQV